MIRGSACPLRVNSSSPLARSQILTRLLPNKPAATRRLSGEYATTLAPCSGSTATGFSFDTFSGLMTARFAGRNGALVRVGAVVLVGERPVSTGAVVAAGRGVSDGAGISGFGISICISVG